MEIYSVNVVEKKIRYQKVTQNLFISGLRKHPVMNGHLSMQYKLHQSTKLNALNLFRDLFATCTLTSK